MIEPLPIRTRLLHGEVVDSYASRHASQNHLTVQEVEDALRRVGTFPSSKGRTHPEREAGWRALGDLTEHAFIRRATDDGDLIIVRSLCERCAGPGGRPYGQLPDVGWVCIRHKRWLGREQTDISRFGAAVVAERHWRSTLAPRGVRVDSPIVLLAAECAAAGLSSNLLEQRSRLVCNPSPDLLGYPETVKLARLLSRSSFLRAMLSEEHFERKRAVIEREVNAMMPNSANAESWRAIARVSDLVLELRKVIRDARFFGYNPEDPWNLLRFLSPQRDEPPWDLYLRSREDFPAPRSPRGTESTG